MTGDLRQLAKEMFLSGAGAALVKQAAEILAPRGIPVMPLKGVLLQRLVYGDAAFRLISDVDLLVPQAQFSEALIALQAAGFTKTRWEGGGWEVTLTNPKGPPLGIDLHRQLTRTVRSRLTGTGMFERGRRDHNLFGATVVLPSALDLFAHLLLHASLEWINLGRIHRPDDFQAVADRLELDLDRCATHLEQQGLAAHVLLMEPLLQRASPSPFLAQLSRLLRPRARANISSAIVTRVCTRFPLGHPMRRIAALALAPSIQAAILSALGDRLVTLSGRENDFRTSP